MGGAWSTRCRAAETREVKGKGKAADHATLAQCYHTREGDVNGNCGVIG